mgnify:CR=1 FL=1
MDHHGQPPGTADALHTYAATCAESLPPTHDHEAAARAYAAMLSCVDFRRSRREVVRHVLLGAVAHFGADVDARGKTIALASLAEYKDLDPMESSYRQWADIYGKGLDLTTFLEYRSVESSVGGSVGAKERKRQALAAYTIRTYCHQLHEKLTGEGDALREASVCTMGVLLCAMADSPKDIAVAAAATPPRIFRRARPFKLNDSLATPPLTARACAAQNAAQTAADSRAYNLSMAAYTYATAGGGYFDYLDHYQFVEVPTGRGGTMFALRVIMR